MKAVVVPLVKNATGDISDKSNYILLSLATIAKFLDRILDLRLSQCLQEQNAQFGFR